MTGGPVTTRSAVGIKIRAVPVIPIYFPMVSTLGLLGPCAGEIIADKNKITVNEVFIAAKPEPHPEKPCPQLEPG